MLADGKRLPVYDIAWGYDAGDEYAHITTNCSPGADGRPTDFFSTSEVTGLMDENERPIVLPSVG